MVVIEARNVKAGNYIYDRLAPLLECRWERVCEAVIDGDQVSFYTPSWRTTKHIREEVEVERVSG